MSIGIIRTFGLGKSWKYSDLQGRGESYADPFRISTLCRPQCVHMHHTAFRCRDQPKRSSRRCVCTRSDRLRGGRPRPLSLQSATTPRQPRTGGSMPGGSLRADSRPLVRGTAVRCDGKQRSVVRSPPSSRSRQLQLGPLTGLRATSG